MSNKRSKKKYENAREKFIADNIIKSISLSSREGLIIIPPDYIAMREREMRELEEKEEG